MTNNTRYGATPEDWEALSVWASLTADLLPVVSNPHAKISPHSNMKSLGKTPSDYNTRKEARGITEWTERVTTMDDVMRWQNFPDYGICLQTRNVRAIDIDVDDVELAHQIHVIAADWLQHNCGVVAPVRSRSNSGKCLMAIRVAPGQQLPKRVMKVNGGIVELLMTGQQFVACGTHPSGVRYAWYGEHGEPFPHPPVDYPEINLADLDALWAHLTSMFATEAPTTDGTARQRGADVDLDDPLADYLHDQGLVLSETRDGALVVDCPWGDGHSSGTSGDTSTVYFPAGTKGYVHGAYICKHASCSGRTTAQFRRMVGCAAPRDPDADFGAFQDETPEVVDTVYVGDLTEHQTHMDALHELVMGAPSVVSLERELAPAIARDGRYRPGDRERIAGWMQKRATQLDSKLPIGTIRKWVAQVFEVVERTFPHVNSEGTPSLTIDNIRALCNMRRVTIAFNEISREIEINIPGETFSVDNGMVARLSWLQSACAEVGMPNNMGTLKGFIVTIGDRNKYNPVADWIREREWDGVDRLPQLYATLVHTDDFDAGLKEMMVRKWLIQAVAAAMSDKAIQTRGVLVLSGEQYLGKSRWLQSLCDGHESLVLPGHTVNPHDKDSVKLAIKHWLCEFGELDATFRKADIAALKAFIGKDHDMMRLPYAAEESKFQRRTVFFGSVNGDRFLVDDTGNTRFWVIPVKDVKHEHKLDMQQIWAQVYTLWRGGEVHWFAKEEMEKVNASAENFRHEDPAWEIVASTFEWDEAAANPGAYNWHWLTSTQVLGLLNVPNGERVSAKLVGGAIRKVKGVQWKKTKEGSKYLVPVGRAEAGLQ